MIIYRINLRHGLKAKHIFPRTPSITFRSFSNKSDKIAAEDEREYFEYTSGRWIYNEPLRLSERHLTFNIENLKKIAAGSINRSSTDIKTFRKIAEGGFNRVFEVTMRDNTQILARLPYPSTVPKRLAVASEVATLNLLRSNGIPVPEVLDYSPEPENAVGAEFIIMTKLPGKPIGDLWFEMSEEERVKLMLALVKLEAKLGAIDLPAYGSIYHPCDLPSDIHRVSLPQKNTNRQYCVGPDASLKWWFEERRLLDIGRGPYVDPVDVLLGVAKKELAWLRTYGQPRFPFERVYRESTDYQKSLPEEHMRSLEQYLKIAPSFVPEQEWLCKPVLRHPDLQPNNIFVTDDLDIVGLLDWQHCSVLPLFLAAGIPNHIQNYDDEESMRFVPPELPENIDEMEEGEQAAAREQYRRRHLHFFYLFFTQKFNEPHFHALSEKGGFMKRKTFTHAGDFWEGNNIPLKADLVHVTRHWQDLANRKGEKVVPPCPISFDDQEANEILRVEDLQEEMNTTLETVRDAIGISSDGWTTKEHYEDAVARAKDFKEMSLKYAETDFEREMTLLHWPFDDHDEKE